MSDSITNSPAITVRDFISDAPGNLELRVLAGEAGAAERELTVARIQKLGLALAGFTNYIHEGRLQIVGQSEVWFLGQLEPEKRLEAIRHLELERIACVLITKGLEPPPEFIEAADAARL